MHKIKSIVIFIILSLLIQIVAGCADKPAQTKKLTVDLIYGSTSLWGKSITSLQWMPDEKGFTYCELDPQNEQSRIWYYDLESNNKTVLVDDRKIDELATPDAGEHLNLDSYVLSPTGKELLLPSDTDLFICSLDTSSLKRLTQDVESEDAPQFSPDGLKIAFLKNHDIHVMEIETYLDTQLTLEGTEQLLVGQVDWVYGEEFSIDTGFFWSPDSRYIAYFKLDQSAVPEFPITDFIPVQNEVALTHYT